jgi:hypothetical protein
MPPKKRSQPWCELTRRSAGAAGRLASPARLPPPRGRGRGARFVWAAFSIAFPGESMALGQLAAAICMRGAVALILLG